jgi:hypothetical protein
MNKLELPLNPNSLSLLINDKIQDKGAFAFGGFAAQVGSFGIIDPTNYDVILTGNVPFTASGSY